MLLTVIRLLFSECCHNSTLEDGILKWLEQCCLDIIQIIEQTDFRRWSGEADDTHTLFREKKSSVSSHVRHLLGALHQITVELSWAKSLRVSVPVLGPCSAYELQFKLRIKFSSDCSKARNCCCLFTLMFFSKTLGFFQWSRVTTYQAVACKAFSSLTVLVTSLS